MSTCRFRIHFNNLPAVTTAYSLQVITLAIQQFQCHTLRRVRMRKYRNTGLLHDLIFRKLRRLFCHISIADTRVGGRLVFVVDRNIANG